MLALPVVDANTVFQHYANMILCIITSTVQFGGQPCWAVSSYCTVGSLRRGRDGTGRGEKKGRGRER